ncbi:hypothetical protein [Neobacillus terrae]|uniref:hypothetical protein n=1 Tax=Neobacillus terrae TaxID=3034837 RepID=UPI0014085B36|nr:hypothetical protein [Neobacillus terrae]NHM33466.1 hypothetical protein [Neobacillus terrae]
MYYHQYVYYPNYLYRFPPQYPPINIGIFESSIKSMQKIASEAVVLLNRISDPGFARRIMNAAQTGNKKEVDRLINSAGVSTPITIKYTPSGILLTLVSVAKGGNCCSLSMHLKWGD